MSANPNSAWTTQQARKLVFSLSERDAWLEFPSQDNDGELT